MKEQAFQDSLVETGSVLAKEQFESLCQRLAATNGDISGVYKDIRKNAYQFNAFQMESLAKLLKAKGISKIFFLRDLHRQEREEKELKAIVGKEGDGKKNTPPSLPTFQD